MMEESSAVSLAKSIAENEAEAKPQKKRYEKPEIIEHEKMIFPKEVWEDFSEGNWCFSCTNCNCS
jgi:hypothetical protein